VSIDTLDQLMTMVSSSFSRAISYSKFSAGTTIASSACHCSACRLSPPRQAEINNLIFAPGFSTALEVTSISGRGVGMDIVRSNIEQIGGTVDVVSAPGSGTSFVIKIPLTLAIVAALIVEIAGERFAFPQLAVLELVRLNGEHRIEWIKSAPLLRLRQRLLPLIDVKKA
jgi:two-component system chemotaxis sensor kinase CheA